jgi:hypothetical protein
MARPREFYNKLENKTDIFYMFFSSVKTLRGFLFQTNEHSFGWMDILDLGQAIVTGTTLPPERPRE